MHMRVFRDDYDDDRTLCYKWCRMGAARQDLWCGTYSIEYDANGIEIQPPKDDSIILRHVLHQDLSSLQHDQRCVIVSRVT